MSIPSELNQDIWIALSRVHKAALTTIEAALKQAKLPPLSWYDVLLELDHAGNAGARAFELREKLLLPQYGLSRLLARIEKAGYLERRPCTDDGRGQHLVITSEGKSIRKAIWVVYAQAIERAVGDRLNPKDGEALLHLLRSFHHQP